MAHAWDNANYPKRREVEYDVTNIDANLADFPALLKLKDAAQIANCSEENADRMATDANMSTPPRRRANGILTALADQITDLGAVVIHWIRAVGDISLFAFRTVGWLVGRDTP